MVVPLVGILFLFYFMLIRPERQKQKRHQNLLDNLKKNDRVVTVGGIYGVVTAVQRDKDEVMLRVEETNNTKIPFTFAAIARVITEESGGEKSSKS